MFSVLLLVSISNVIYAQWEATSGPPGGAVRCVVTNGSRILAGSAGGVYLSSNNGDTWNLTSLPAYCGVSSSILIIDSTFYVASGFGVVKSTDWGASWQLMNSGLSDTNITSLAICGTTLLAGTYSGGVFVSSDYGLNWSPANTGLTNPYVKKIYVKDSIIYAGTSWFQGGVFISYNNGNSWVLSDNGLPNEELFDILKVQNWLFCCFGDSGIFISNDFGQSWFASGLPIGFGFYYKCLSNFGNSILIGGGNGAYITADGCNTWQDYNQGGLDFAGGVECFSMNSTYLFAATGGNGVWRRRLTDLGNPDIVSDNEKINVYPNPAKDKISIVFSLPANGSIKVLLVDLSGNTIKTIDAGETYTQHIETSISDLPNGVYLLRIELQDKVISKKVSVVR